MVLFDKYGNVWTYPDLQDKKRWCKEGESQEEAFVREYGEKIGYVMNPRKKEDRFAPDLLSTQTGVLADLKSQHSPFLKAMEFYRIEPTYAVVFNVKDKIRYEQYYPDIDIIYFVDWIVVRGEDERNGKAYTVDPLLGIYKISFRDLNKILSNAEIHEYKQRRNDQQGNARGSYVIDIRNNAFEKLL